MASTARRTTHAPPAPGTAAWKRLVTRGREAVTQKSSAQWTLGELALEVVPWLGQGAVGRGSEHQIRERLDAYAEAVGLAPATIREYRRTAHHWPAESRLEGVTFSVHQLFAGKPDALRELAAECGGHVSYGAALKAIVIDKIAEPDEPEEPPSVEQVRAALREPEMARAVVEDDEVRERVEAATWELDREAEAEHEADLDFYDGRGSDAGPPTPPMHAKTLAEEIGHDQRPFELIHRLTGAASLLASSLSLASEHDLELEERWQSEAERKLTRLRELLGLLEAMVRGETGTDWDAELARLVGEEA